MDEDNMAPLNSLITVRHETKSFLLTVGAVAVPNPFADSWEPATFPMRHNIFM